MSKPNVNPPAAGPKPDFTTFVPETVDFEAIIAGKEPAAPIEQEEEVIQPPPDAAKPPVETQKLPDEDEFDLDARPKLGNETPPPAKPGRPPNSAIREQLNALSTQKKELEDKLKAEEQIRIDAQAKWEAEKKAREELENKFAEAERQTGARDLNNHPSVREIVKPWEESFRQLAEDLEDSGVTDAMGKQQLVVEMAMNYQNAKNLADKEAQQAALDKVRRAISHEFGDENQANVMRLVREGAKRLVEVRQKMEELQQNYPEVEYQSQIKGFREAVEDYSTLDAECFNPDPAIEKQDPFNPRVVLKNLVNASPEVRQVADSAINFARQVMLPPAPINPADIAHLTPEQRREHIKQHHAKKMEARRHLAKILPEAIVARQVLPGLLEELTMLRSIVSGERSATRGKPIIDDAPPPPEEDEDEDDLSKFTPKNPEMENFERDVLGKR